MKLAVISVAVLVSVAFLLHPQITLEFHDGELWVGGDSYGDWLWNVPNSVSGVRYTTGFTHSIVYCIATFLVAGGIWITIARTLPSLPVSQHPVAGTRFSRPTNSSQLNSHPRVFESYMYFAALTVSLSPTMSPARRAPKSPSFRSSGASTQLASKTAFCSR